MWHADLGPLVKLPARPGAEKRVTGHDLHCAISAAEDAEERIRLLYVATTRAADYLVLSSGIFPGDLDAPTAPWMKLLAERFDLQTGRCIATLPVEHPVPIVKITTRRPESARLLANATAKRGLDALLEMADAISRTQFDELGGSSTGLNQRLAEPVLVDRASRRRFSVSRLTGKLQALADSNSFLAPLTEMEGLLDEPGAAAELGTLVHRVLARVRFDSSADISGLVELCAESMGPAAKEHASTAERLIGEFMKSDRAAKLNSAKAIHRETEFLILWPPHRDSAVELDCALPARFYRLSIPR